MHDLPLALLVLFAAAAVLFAIGAVFSRRGSAAPALISARNKKKMMALMEAAATAYRAARRERMVIATVAEKAQGGAQAWFAQSIASVVPVYRVGVANAFEKLEDGTGIGTAPQALYIQRHDYQTYVRWARSMQ